MDTEILKKGRNKRMQKFSDNKPHSINAIDIIAGKLKFLCKDSRCVLLLVPPLISKGDFDAKAALKKRYPSCPPYGLGIINKRLIDNGYKSDILDLNYEVLNFLNIDKKLFYYDIWKEKLKNKIDSFKPDIIGITCMFTVTSPQMYVVCDFIKEINNKLPIFAGGMHSSIASKTVLEECKSIDFVCLYEGDSNFIDILDFAKGKSSESTLRQITTIKDSRYYSLDSRVRELDIDSAPEYGDLPLEKYSDLGKIGNYFWLLPKDVKASTVISNRGCMGNCIYCTVRAFYGGTIESRSVKAVVDEIEYLRNKYRITHFMWLDDVPFYNEKRSVELFNEITKRRLNITWDATNGTLASSITQDVMDSAIKSGCIGLHLGIESGSPEILKSIRKPASIGHFKNAALILRNYPQIFTKGFLMFGFFGETIGQMLETINLALELGLDWYSIQILTIFPSTEAQKILEKEKRRKEEYFVDKNFFGSANELGERELREKVKAKEFVNVLENDPKKIPNKEELKDIWFLMDYKVNYEKILKETREIKLKMFQKLLEDICRRVEENPLSTLYLGIVEKKLGNQERFEELKKLAKVYLNNSAYWQKRFEVLGLYKFF